MARLTKVFIHATNIHQGGGQSLLDALLKALDDKVTFVLSLDDRMPTPRYMAHNIQIKRVKPSMLQRIEAERWLFKTVGEDDVVLCFGNLPPLFRLRGRTVVFLQNRYLIEDVPLHGFPLKIRTRLIVERLWLSKKLMNVDEFVVQTPTMKRLMEIKTRGRVPVSVLPFVADPCGYTRSLPQRKDQKDIDYDFVYVASGEPHKNHRRLIEAWCLLAEEGLFPSLCLTLDEARFAGLCQEIEAMHQQYGLKVENAGGLSHQDVLSLYKKAGASIYPSTFESFGLPLIEARQANLPVLASELDYVRDVCVPVQTFDPHSPVSMARAVKRFLGKPNPTVELHTPAEFWRALLGNV